VRNLTSLELDTNSCQKGVVAIIFYSSKEVVLLLIIVPMVCMVNHFMLNGSLCFCLLQFRLYEMFSMIILNINLMDKFYNFIESSGLQIGYGVHITVYIICATI
jgi:hypothetical protein